MRIFQNVSFTEKLLFLGIIGYAAFSFAYKSANGPAKHYEFPERNLAVSSVINPDRDNCPGHDISRIVSQQQMDPARELAKFIDCGNKGFLAVGDIYTNLYECFYIFNSEFLPIPSCKSEVPISSLDISIEMANANRDYQELLRLIRLMGEK